MRRYSWKPDLPDHRDHRFVATIPTLPQHVDLRPKCTKVEDQGQLGSCTGNAIAGALEALEHIEGKRALNVSRLFIYYQERVIEGTVRQDAGAEIRDGVKACAQTGYCLERYWPYDVARFAEKPPAVAYNNAVKHKIAEYLRCDNFVSVQQSLAAGFPVVFGFTVYDSFESDAVAKTGVVPMPGKGERVLGGHAVLAVGYDEPTQRVIVRNSWGAKWGQKGYFTMPYAYLEDRDLSDDFWTIRK